VRSHAGAWERRKIEENVRILNTSRIRKANLLGGPKTLADDKIGNVAFLTERNSNSSMVIRKPWLTKSHMRNIAR
jgi:hypothetical protein